MFLHGGVFHLLFNMLALWMFGAELERIWGTRYFLKFYFVTGIGAGALPCCSRSCRSASRSNSSMPIVIGASGAIYGLLLAYALYFPDRPIYMYFVFPIPAKILRRDHGSDRVLLVDIGVRAASRMRPISAGCWSPICSSRARACIRCRS